MKVFSWEEVTKTDFDLFSYFDLKNSRKTGSALAIGAFDGPHLGHQSLFDAVFAQKDFLHGLVTFSRSPRAVKETHSFEGLVSTLRLRLERFEQLGFDFVLVIDFSAKFSKIKGRDFLMRLCKSLAMSFLTVGPFFRCGNNLDTGENEIRAFAAQNDVVFSVMNEVVSDGTRISSTLIRQAASAGDFETAKKLLGFSYRLDMTGAESEKIHGGQTWQKNALTQIVPPVGQYKVCIETVKSGSGFPVFRLAGTLIVDEGNLRCLIPDQKPGTFVRTIIFGNPEGKSIEEA